MKDHFLKSTAARITGAVLLLIMEQILMNMLAGGIHAEERNLFSFLACSCAVLLAYELAGAGYRSGYNGIYMTSLDQDPYDLVSVCILSLICISRKVDHSAGSQFIPSLLQLIWMLTTAVQVKSGTIWSGTLLNQFLRKNGYHKRKDFSRMNAGKAYGKCINRR